MVVVMEKKLVAIEQPLRNEKKLISLLIFSVRSNQEPNTRVKHVPDRAVHTLTAYKAEIDVEKGTRCEYYLEERIIILLPQPGNILSARIPVVPSRTFSRYQTVAVH